MYLTQKQDNFQFGGKLNINMIIEMCLELIKIYHRFHLLDIIVLNK